MKETSSVSLSTGELSEIRKLPSHNVHFSQQRDIRRMYVWHVHFPGFIYFQSTATNLSSHAHMTDGPRRVYMSSLSSRHQTSLSGVVYYQTKSGLDFRCGQGRTLVSFTPAACYTNSRSCFVWSTTRNAWQKALRDGSRVCHAV